jgi:hypothetical protein
LHPLDKLPIGILIFAGVLPLLLVLALVLL